MKNDKTYLGDSVYFEFDGFNIELYTDNGRGPENNIVLEPEVVVALLKKLTSNEFTKKLLNATIISNGLTQKP